MSGDEQILELCLPCFRYINIYIFLSPLSFLGWTIIKVILLIFNLKTLMDQKKYWQEMKYFAAECENILFNGTQQHSLLTVPLYICSRQLLFVIHFLHPFRESWSGFACKLEERCLGLSIKILMETSNPGKK